MAQDGYARHGLHKHHVGCSAKGHGWRGQICQVAFFFGSCRRSQGDTFFLAWAYFSDLWKETDRFLVKRRKWQTSTGGSPRLAFSLLSFEAKRLKPPSPEQFAKDTVKRAIGNVTSLEFPQKNRRKWRKLTGKFPSYHTCIRPLVVTYWCMRGPPPRLLIDEILREFGWLEHRNQFDICHINRSAANFVHQQLLVPTFEMCSLATQIWEDFMYPTLGKNRFRKTSSKQRRK